MTALIDRTHNPEILIGETDHRRLTVAALTDVEHSADQVDFLLYELDRARVVADGLLPADVVRIGSIVRYRADAGEERMAKLALPEAAGRDATYHLSVTSMKGAALLGLRPGDVMAWLDPDGARHRIEVLKVANPA